MIEREGVLRTATPSVELVLALSSVKKVSLTDARHRRVSIMLSAQGATGN